MLGLCINEVARARTNQHKDRNRELRAAGAEDLLVRRRAAMGEIGAELDAVRPAFSGGKRGIQRFDGGLDKDGHKAETTPMRLRRTFAAFLAAAAFAAASCSDNAGPALLPLKDIGALALQLDTIDAGLSAPQLKSFSALALPMLAAGLDVEHMDSTVLGKTVEWNSVQHNVFLTTRAGTPANKLQVTLYKIDSTGLPAPSKVEIGYAYLEPLNAHNGGRPDSSMLRFTLFTLPHPGGGVVADWVVWRLPADTACGQCATISAGIMPTAPGGRTIYLTIPYNIPPGGDGSFAGSSTGGGFEFSHNATLPGPSSTGSTAGWAFGWQGDSVSTVSGPLHPSAGQLIGTTSIMINGLEVATATRSSPGVLRSLFAVPADIADYIEWPTFVIFFCGC